MKRCPQSVRLWLLLVLVAGLGLQLFFVLRVASLALLDPGSSAFMRSEAWRILNGPNPWHWQQQWVPYSQISKQLKRAVVSAEDDGFSNHDGVDWEALEKAWQKNAQAQARADKKLARTNRQAPPPRAKVVGGSTITQQLAKNLFLSGERTLLRKGQELALTLLLETLLSKQRILELYLNSVEWGDGIFGAEAAAQHYFRKPAARLNAAEAAKLAVMLPRPKYFEKRWHSDYLNARAAAIENRLEHATLP